MKQTVLTALFIVAIAGCTDSGGPGSKATLSPTPPTTVNRDNTAVNTRDRSGATKTPIDQNENQKDIDITARIRKGVVDTKMSTDAQNAKIIIQNGKVTLRGPVESGDEKKRIEEIANEVAGAENVDNQLEIQP